MKQNGADSASPICPNSHAPLGINPNSGVFEGKQVFSRFCGWAYMWTRKLYQTTGGFDENFVFWCSDNTTALQLNKFHKKHILVTSSIVHHVAEGSNTINSLNKKIVRKYTKDEIEKFNSKFNANLHVDPSWKLPTGI